MNSLDDLRAALREPAGDEPEALDVALIMGTGRRIRLRRRAGAAVAGLATVGILAGAGALSQTGPSADQSDRALPSAGAPAAPGPTPSNAGPATPPRTVRPSPGESNLGPAEVLPPPATTHPGLDPNVKVLSSLVRTTTRIGGKELVFYVIDYRPRDRPGVQFAVQAALRAPDGRLTPMAFTYDKNGLPCSPGQPAFGALFPSLLIDGLRFPSFGYYCGPEPAEIVATEAGTRIVARQAKPWRERQELVVFWLGVVDVPVGQHPDTLNAYDENGDSIF